MNRRPWTEDEAAILERMAAEAFSLREIGAALGRSRAAVACKIARMGLEMANGPGRPRLHDYQAIGAMLDAGARAVDVIAVHGRGAEYAARMVRR